MEKCKKCGSEFDVSRMSETTSGEWLCEECAKGESFCSRCERVINIQDDVFAKVSPGEYLCESCMNRY